MGSDPFAKIIFPKILPLMMSNKWGDRDTEEFKKIQADPKYSSNPDEFGKAIDNYLATKNGTATTAQTDVSSAKIDATKRQTREIVSEATAQDPLAKIVRETDKQADIFKRGMTQTILTRGLGSSGTVTTAGAKLGNGSLS